MTAFYFSFNIYKEKSYKYLIDFFNLLVFLPIVEIYISNFSKKLLKIYYGKKY